MTQIQKQSWLTRLLCYGKFWGFSRKSAPPSIPIPPDWPPPTYHLGDRVMVRGFYCGTIVGITKTQEAAKAATLGFWHYTIAVELPPPHATEWFTLPHCYIITKV